jgi:hypothetical protein
MIERFKVMKVLGHGIRLAVGTLALGLAGSAGAQENLDYGKTPAQLYASDCAICHKSPQGLAAKGGGLLGLEGFLREHYTASRESAAAIAGYLRSMGNAPVASTRTTKGKKGDDTSRDTAKRPDTKTGDIKREDNKPAKSAEPKTSESKPADTKPAEPKAAESKPVEAKPAGAEPAEPKSVEPKPADGSKSD